MFARGGTCLYPARIIHQIIDEGWFASLHLPTRQPLPDLELEAANFSRNFIGEITITSTVVQKVILCVEQHDRSLLSTNRIIEQRQSAVQSPVKIEARRYLRENSQKCFRVLLFTLQLRSPFNDAHFKFPRQTLRLVEQTSVLNSYSRLVRKRTEDLQVIFG